jgi:homoserine dehydrogenase
MGGIGQNILREMEEDNEVCSPSVKEILKEFRIEKKRKKLQDRIDLLNEEMRTSLTKKTSSTKEISLPNFQKKIKNLQDKLKSL